MCDCFVQDKAAKTQHSSATQGFCNAVLGKRINNNGSFYFASITYQPSPQTKMPMPLSSIEKLITSNRLAEAITQLLQRNEEKQANLRGELLAHQANLETLNRKARMGLLAHSEETVDRAKLVNGILATYTEIKNYTPETAANNNENSTNPPNSNISNSKNVVSGSVISAGGNVHIGDTITHHTTGSSPSEDVPEKETEKVKTILVLSANPKDMQSLRLGEEVSKIEKSLERASKRRAYDIKSKWAVQIKDVRRAMLDLSPAIVHFSGHGTDTGDLHFENEAGNSQYVSATALGNFFELFKTSTQCLLLMACYSEEQAKAIAPHISCVIGMNHGIPDDAAIAFSEAFYDTIGAGKNYEFAFKIAVNAIAMYDLEASLMPVIYINGTKRAA